MSQIETKVQASTYAAAASGLVVWVLGKYVFKGTVPDVIVSWIYVLVPALAAFVAGYIAPHTARPDISVTRPVPPTTPPTT